MMKGLLRPLPNLGMVCVLQNWCHKSCLWASCVFVISCACSATKGTLGGMFGMLKGLVGSKSLSREDMESVLDKMRDHLIGKF